MEAIKKLKKNNLDLCEEIDNQLSSLNLGGWTEQDGDIKGKYLNLPNSLHEVTFYPVRYGTKMESESIDKLNELSTQDDNNNSYKAKKFEEEEYVTNHFWIYPIAKNYIIIHHTKYKGNNRIEPKTLILNSENAIEELIELIIKEES